MISFVCSLITIGCAIATICINISINNNTTYDLYEFPDDPKKRLVMIKHYTFLSQYPDKHIVLRNVTKNECKAYAKIHNKKIKR